VKQSQVHGTAILARVLDQNVAPSWQEADVTTVRELVAKYQFGPPPPISTASTWSYIHTPQFRQERGGTGGF
jgi:hypothetical protein